MTWSHNAEVSVVSATKATDFEEEAMDFHGEGEKLPGFSTIRRGLRCGSIETFIIRFGRGRDRKVRRNSETRPRLFRGYYRSIIFYARIRMN